MRQSGGRRWLRECSSSWLRLWAGASCLMLGLIGSTSAAAANWTVRQTVLPLTPAFQGFVNDPTVSADGTFTEVASLLQFRNGRTVRQATYASVISPTGVPGRAFLVTPIKPLNEMDVQGPPSRFGRRIAVPVGLGPLGPGPERISIAIVDKPGAKLRLVPTGLRCRNPGVNYDKTGVLEFFCMTNGGRSLIRAQMAAGASKFGPATSIASVPATGGPIDNFLPIQQTSTGATLIYPPSGPVLVYRRADGADFETIPLNGTNSPLVSQSGLVVVPVGPPNEWPTTFRFLDPSDTARQPIPIAPDFSPTNSFLESISLSQTGTLGLVWSDPPFTDPASGASLYRLSLATHAASGGGWQVRPVTLSWNTESSRRWVTFGPDDYTVLTSHRAITVASDGSVSSQPVSGISNNASLYPVTRATGVGFLSINHSSGAIGSIEKRDTGWVYSQHCGAASGCTKGTSYGVAYTQSGAPVVVWTPRPKAGARAVLRVGVLR